MQLPPGQPHQEIAAWLAEQGLRNLPLEEMVDGFARRLNEAGVLVARVFVGMNTLHPLLRAHSLIWDRVTGPSTRFQFQHGEVALPIMRESPFATMLRDGTSEMRCDLTLPPRAGEWPVFAELRGLGMTDWLGRVFPFGELAPQLPGAAPESARELWLVASLATDHAGGFGVSEMATLNGLLPLFALAVKATTMRSVGQGLLSSYLGSDPARRVLSGAVQRGEVQEVEAVLFYADLRDFTALADAFPGRELIALLDE